MRNGYLLLCLLLAPWPSPADEAQAEMDAAVSFVTGDWPACLAQTTKLFSTEAKSYGRLDLERHAGAFVRAVVCCALLGDQDPDVQAWHKAIAAGDLDAALLTERLAPVLRGQWDQLPKVLDAAGWRLSQCWERFGTVLADAATRVEQAGSGQGERVAAAARIREAVVYLDALALAYGWCRSEQGAAAALSAIVGSAPEVRERASAILHQAWVSGRLNEARRLPSCEGPSATSLSGIVRLLSQPESRPDPAGTLYLLQVTDDPLALQPALWFGADTRYAEANRYALDRLLELARSDPAVLVPEIDYRNPMRARGTVANLADLRRREPTVPYPARRELRRLLVYSLVGLQSSPKGAMSEAEQAARIAAVARDPDSDDAALGLADWYLFQNACYGGVPEKPTADKVVALYTSVLGRPAEPSVLAAAWMGLAEVDPASAWQRRKVMQRGLEDSATRLSTRRLLSACAVAAADWAGARPHLEALIEADSDSLNQPFRLALTATVCVLCGDPGAATALLDRRTDRLDVLGLMMTLATDPRQRLTGVPTLLWQRAAAALSDAKPRQSSVAYTLRQLAAAVPRTYELAALARLIRYALVDCGALPEAAQAERDAFIQTCLGWFRARSGEPAAMLELIPWLVPQGSGALLSVPDVHHLLLACFDLARERRLPEDRVRLLLAGYGSWFPPYALTPEQRAELVREARSHYP